jgi:DNA-binding CsgD family transcriptional regulator
MKDDDDIQDYVKPWVGLTKNEVETLSYIAEGNTWIAIELAEAKLKEKNHE